MVKIICLFFFKKFGSLIMCTLNEEFQKSFNIKDDLVCEDNKVCLKCKVFDPVVFLRSDGVYCRECFILRITHKFRLEFGKSHLIRDNEKVFILTEYNKYSFVLLHLINEGISKQAKKKLRFVPLCVFIIDDDFKGSIEEFKTQFINPINSFGLPICIYHVNQIYKKDLEPLYSNIDEFKQINSSNYENQDDQSIDMKNQTSKTTFRNILRKQLLVKIATKLGISKIITSENADQLAANMIMNVIEGRGDQLSYEMGFVDNRYNEFSFVRPMKNFTTVEVDAYIQLYSLQSLETYSNEIKSEYSLYTSMQNLTQIFLQNLQKDNENTLPIICRIGEKISQNENATSMCLICSTPFALETSTRQTSSRIVSSNCLNTDSINCCNVKESANSTDPDIKLTNSKHENNIQKCCTNKNQVNFKICCRENQFLFRNKEEMLKYSCYGCKILLNDMKDINKLPSYIFDDLLKIKNRENMHEIVKDYLLE